MNTGSLSRTPHPPSEASNSGALEAFEPVVPITLLSTDDHLRQTLRMLLDDQPVFVARTLDELSQLAALGRCSIVITDQVLAPSALAPIKHALRDCAPPSVLIAVGERAESELLVRMLGDGAIDRFMVKPLEGRRTRFALRSAALQFRSLRAVESAMESAEEKERLEEHTLIRRPPTEIVASAALRVEVRSVAPRHAAAIVPRPSIATLERRVTRPPAEVVVGDPTLIGRRSSSINPPQPQPQPESRESKTPVPVRSLSTFLWPAALVVVLLLVALLSVGLVSMRTSRVDPRPIVASNLTAAQEAVEAGRLIEPPEQSALHYYAATLALDPANADAQRGIDALVDRLLTSAKDEILAGRLEAAQAAVANARRLRPSHRQLPYLDAELANARERERLLIEATSASQSATVEPARAQPKVTKSASPKSVSQSPAQSQSAEESVALQRTQDERAMLQRILERTGENKLLEPADDSAKLYLARLTQLAPQSAAVKQGTDALGRRLVANAQLAMFNKNLDDASRLIAAAHDIGFAGSELAGATAALEVARAPAAPAAAASQVPARVKYVAAEYPREARLDGLEGWVDVAIGVTALGNVVDPHAVGGHRRELFGRAAIDAVRQWKFAPMTDSDATLVRPLTVRVEFRLDR